MRNEKWEKLMITKDYNDVKKQINDTLEELHDAEDFMVSLSFRETAYIDKSKDGGGGLDQ